MKSLKYFFSGKLTFIACRRQDGEGDQLFWSRGIIPSISSFGDQSGLGRVGIMLAEKWIFLWKGMIIIACSYILVGTTIVKVMCCYAPQSDLPPEEKDTFYWKVFRVVASLPEEEMLVLGGDFNGHVGDHSARF